MIRLGLYLYDHLTRRNSLSPSKALDLKADVKGAPLKDIYTKGLQYADCWTDDARLVILNAVSAAQKGAEIKTRTRCTNMHKLRDCWRVELEDVNAARSYDVRAKMVINAAGPWVSRLIKHCGLAKPDTPDMRLVKGSHIIIDKAFEGEHAYILQQGDKRIIFAIPYEGQYTLIGTTEEDISGDPRASRISEAEIQYLCNAYNTSFKNQITADDVLWTYSGVRPLIHNEEDSATSATRDYLLYHHDQYNVPLYSVFGGKLTTYRALAEHMIDTLLGDRRAAMRAWTGDVALSGADFANGDFERFIKEKHVQYSWLPQKILRRYGRAYGTQMSMFLKGARSVADLGQHFGAGLYKAEVDYMIAHEWAQTSEDILWRRSKIGLNIDQGGVQELSRYITQRLNQHEPEQNEGILE